MYAERRQYPASGPPPGIEQVAVFDIDGHAVALEGRWGTDLILIGG